MIYRVTYYDTDISELICTNQLQIITKILCIGLSPRISTVRIFKLCHRAFPHRWIFNNKKTPDVSGFFFQKFILDFQLLSSPSKPTSYFMHRNVSQKSNCYVVCSQVSLVRQLFYESDITLLLDIRLFSVHHFTKVKNVLYVLFLLLE